MKKILFTIGLLTSIFTLSQAQISAGLNIGPAIPSGGYAEFAKVGFGFTAEGRYTLTDQLSVGLNIGHYRTGVKGLVVNGSIPLEGNYNITPITTVAEYYFLEDEIRPYAGFELGAAITGYRWKVTPEGGETIEVSKESKVGLGVAPVVGVLYEMADGLHLSANMKYTVSSTKIQIFEEKSVHMFTVNFGVRITPSEF